MNNKFLPGAALFIIAFVLSNLASLAQGDTFYGDGAGHSTTTEQQASISELRATVAQQQREFQATTAEQRTQIHDLTAQLKQQAIQIQKGSARLELNKAAQKTIARGQ